MHVSARTDYTLRAMLAAAARYPQVVTATTLAVSQGIPHSFLQSILLDLRRAGLLHSLRGADGAYALTRAPEKVSVGDVLRATNGAITTVRGRPAAAAPYPGLATGLREVWLSVNEAIEGVVDQATLACLLPPRATESPAHG
ncbi:MAG TPA: Rrf2 family transcriptional regulator [Pilimelia sp.]|nr:Rrf2 family transcriptional regulator [Pilimelia sp.]